MIRPNSLKDIFEAEINYSYVISWFTYLLKLYIPEVHQMQYIYFLHQMGQNIRQKSIRIYFIYNTLSPTI